MTQELKKVYFYQLPNLDKKASPWQYHVSCNIFLSFAKKYVPQTDVKKCL